MNDYRFFTECQNQIIVCYKNENVKRFYSDGSSLDSSLNISIFSEQPTHIELEQSQAEKILKLWGFSEKDYFYYNPPKLLEEEKLQKNEIIRSVLPGENVPFIILMPMEWVGKKVKITLID